MKRTFLLLLAFVLVFSIVACTSKDVNEASIEENLPGETNDESKMEDITVIDHLGRTITMNKEPERIVSGYYISTSALIALGLEERVVGLEAKADSRPIYSLAAPELLELPNVGTAKEFDLEGCIALEPDLVILPVKLKDQIKTLEDMGITVLGVNPESQELLEEMITMIGRLTGAENYEELLAYYEEKEEDISAIASSVEYNPTIYLGGNNSFLSTATKNMYQNDLIESTGGINVAGDIEDSYWVNISYEQLVEYNPEYIVIAPEAEYTKEDVLNDNNIKGIAAIEEGNVFAMPSEFEAWDSPVPSSVLGKMWLASTLHPDEYPYDRFVDEVYGFYKEFYGFEIDKGALNIND